MALFRRNAQAPSPTDRTAPGRRGRAAVPEDRGRSKETARLEHMAEMARNPRAKRPRRTVTIPTVPEEVLARQRTRARGALDRSLTWQRAFLAATGPFGRLLTWVSPLGWTLLALGLLVWVVGAWMSWVELVAMGITFVVLVVLAVLVALGRTSIAVRTEVDRLRVTAGEPVAGRVVVTNRSSRRLLPILLRLPVDEEMEEVGLPSIPGRGEAVEEFDLPTHRRGVVRIGRVTTLQGDPLGLLRRTQRWTEPVEVVVHPVTVGLEPGHHGIVRDLEGQETPDVSASDLAFHTLRDYTPGDERRHIHWRSSAKHDRLLVRQFNDTRRSHVAVLLDTDPAAFADRDALEAAVSTAASIAVRAVRDGQEATVVGGGQLATRTTAPVILDALARLEIGTGDVYGSAERARALAGDASTAVLVTGPRRPFIEAQRALGRFGTEVARIVIVLDPEARTTMRRAGPLTVLTVPSLEALRGALVRTVAA